MNTITYSIADEIAGLATEAAELALLTPRPHARLDERARYIMRRRAYFARKATLFDQLARTVLEPS